MAYDRESIIRKLKKLRAKAESAEAIGSEAEAQTFAEAIQRMLSEYKVEEAEIAENDDLETDPIVRVNPPTAKYNIPYKHREVVWMHDLANIVAFAHYCRNLLVPGTNLVVFAGRQNDAEVAAEVWCKLVVAAESMADREYVDYFYECKRRGDVRKARGFRGSFLLGFVSRIRTRYIDHMNAIREYYSHDQKALTTLKAARSKVDDWVDKNVNKERGKQVDRTVQNRAGYLKGQDKAAELKLTTAKEIK